MSGSDGLVDDPDARRKTIHRKSTGAEVDDRGIETAPEGNASHSRLMLGLLCRGLQTAAPQDARSPRPSSPVIVPSRVFSGGIARHCCARIASGHHTPRSLIPLGNNIEILNGREPGPRALRAGADQHLGSDELLNGGLVRARRTRSPSTVPPELRRNAAIPGGRPECGR
jgi:hypothetical protein